jgi:hypothetical protein
MPPQYSVAEGVGSSKGKAALAVARPCGGRKRHLHGEACWARGYAVSTVGVEEAQRRRDIRSQEQRETAGEDEDGACSAMVRTVTWQPLGLLTIVKPPALRGRHDRLPWWSIRRGRRISSLLRTAVAG